jgi:hypothetical protein
MPSQEWHWDQGNKYAVEAIKTTLVLNGAAAIALMTFATQTQKFSSLLIAPLLCFTGGAGFSAIAFFGAYMAQLVYGNAAQPGTSPEVSRKIWKGGQRWNIAALALMMLSVLAFGLGIGFGAFSLPKLAG